MAPNPVLLRAIETLGYRVTVGDVAAQAGLGVNLAQRGLLALASEAGGHLQVADTGEIVYLFPKNFRSILRNKLWQLRLKEGWEKIWKVLFYIIRVSFGIVLIASILLMLVAIIIVLIAATFLGQDGDGSSSSDSSDGHNPVFIPFLWIPDLFWIFNPSYDYNYYQRQEQSYKTEQSREKQINFLEAVFSFLFGDGNPNIALEKRRWQEIGTVIRNNQGAVIAQQLAPYLDNVNEQNRENEDYILPVLSRFDGYPEVSPQGEIIYYFPQMQVTARKRRMKPVSAFLKEKSWQFSQAGSGQILLAIGLGVFNFILALVLGHLLQGDIALQLGQFFVFVQSIYWFLLGYASSFLGIPLIRYFVNQWRNGKINVRNQLRQARADFLSIPNPRLQEKIRYARQFATEKVIATQDITYSTETDLLEQEIDRSDKIDEEWQRRLEGE